MKKEKMQLLIVDDQATDITQLNFLANHLGFETNLTWDGSEAWYLSSKKKYDLVILDWNMPDCPGWVFLNRLDRFLSQQSNQKKLTRNIVLHTGENLNLDGFAENCHFKIIDVWKKPLSPNEILRKIKNVKRIIKGE